MPCLLQNLSRRGLHATALEYAKLLLGLDPQDPKGVLFCIDYLAIRAQQFQYLQVGQPCIGPLQFVPGLCPLSLIAGQFGCAEPAEEMGSIIYACLHVTHWLHTCRLLFLLMQQCKP